MEFGLSRNYTADWWTVLCYCRLSVHQRVDAVAPVSRNASSVALRWHGNIQQRRQVLLILTLAVSTYVIDSAGHKAQQELSSCWDRPPFGHSRRGLWFILPASVNRESGGCAPFRGGNASPSNTMWHGPRLTFAPSGILVDPTVWPQYMNVTDRQDRTDNGPIA